MPELTSKRILRAWCLGGLLFTVYILSMSGSFSSGDERFILDAVDSIITRGDILTNQTVNLRPLQTTNVEPIAYLMPAPLYWLMYNIPWVGNVHGIFVYSPLLVALTGIVMYLFLGDLGYDERLALIGTLLFGLTTIVWPYSKTFFREPLAMMLVFSAAFALNRWRLGLTAGDNRRWLWLGVGLVFMLLGLFGKEAMLLTLPTLMLIATPVESRQHKRLILAAIGISVAIAILTPLAITVLENVTTLRLSRYDIVRRSQAFASNILLIPKGLGGFLLSPGKSIWAFSPILLFALASPFLVSRERWRETWLMLGTMLFFAFVYAGVRGEVWHGGQGWGPRYMVPITPFLLISAMPAIKRLFENQAGRVVVAVVAFYGFLVQVGGLMLPIETYTIYIGEQIGQAPWQRLPVWSFTWSQPLVALRLLPEVELDSLWLIGRPRPAALAVLTVTIGLWAGLIVWAEQQRQVRYHLYGFAGMVLLTTGVVFFALSTAWEDPRYQGGNTSLHEMLAYLEAETDPDDVILLATEGYLPFFLNYYKGDRYWFSAPLSPGERYNCDQPINTSLSIEERLAEETQLLMRDIRFSGYALPDGVVSPTVWIVEDIPEAACPLRPVIEFGSNTGFVGQTVELTPSIRLTPWVPQSARFDASNTRPIETRFDSLMQLRLAHFSQTELAPEETLGIALGWQALQTINEDFTVSIVIQASDGFVVQQVDRQPLNGFMPTSMWVPGQLIIDRYAIEIPELLPEGTYTVGVVVYRWPSLDRLTTTRNDVALPDNMAPIGQITVLSP